MDESGGYEAPDSSPSATPVIVILGLIVDVALVPALTRDFLALKRRHFPGRFASGYALDHILTEVKGSDILQMTRSSRHNPQRQAHRFRLELMDTVERYGCCLVGRVWVKEPSKGIDPQSSYCYAVQDIAKHFGQYLEAQNDVGILIADGREHHANLQVAHSIFTQKWRAAGDPYSALREVPLFAASDNHAGLQIADLIASSLVFPWPQVRIARRGPGLTIRRSTQRFASCSGHA